MKLKEKNRTKTMSCLKKYFTVCQSPSNMYKKLSETENTEINKT